MKLSIFLTLILNITYCEAQNKTLQSIPNVVYDSTYQVRIQNTLPNYLIHFHIIEGKNAAGEVACLFSIATRSSIDQKLIDSVFYSKKDFEADYLCHIFLSHGDYDEAKPKFIDVNFDGYLDIRMVSFQDNFGNFSYDYLLFNPEQSKYLFNEEFTDVCNNAEIDASKKQIRVTSTTEKDCPCCWQQNTYRVQNNHPQLYQTITSELVTVNGVSKQKQTTERLVKGKMTIVNVDYSNVPQY
jgi:hypothetical protein